MGYRYHIQPYNMNGLNWRLVPDDQKRDNIVVIAGFMPSWWRKEYGITFGKEYHSNPDVRKATLIRCQELLKERFGHLPNFSLSCGWDYNSSYPIERPYGDALIPGLFGCNIVYDTASGHPFAEELHLSDDKVFDLKVPDIEKHPLIKSIYPILQEDAPKDRVIGQLGLEGVLNIALKLRGEQIFLDMITNPDRARHIFTVITETMNKLGHLACKWRDPRGKEPTYLVTCNCTVNMISSNMYAKQLLQFDQYLYDSFDLFGIHNCPWRIDEYVQSYAQMKNLAYLDMGMETNIDLVYKFFPDLTPSVFFFPPDEFKRLSIPQIKKEITKLCKRIGRGYILLQDIEAGTTDAQIEAAYEAASKL